MKQQSHIILRLNLISLFILGHLILAYPADAQINPSWSTPSTIPGLTDSGIYPVFILDTEGTIHLFHSQPIGDNMAIFYTRWSPKNGWSHLVDIITFPEMDVRISGAILDHKGWIHLIFWSGDDTWANIYYTKAPVTNADESTVWLEPIPIGESALDPPAATIIQDKDGSIIVIYSGNPRGNGLYVTQSEDDGKTWSSPEPFFNTYDNQLWPSGLKPHIDLDGNIYTVWAVGDNSGNGQAVYFSKRTSNTKEWSPPIILAEAIDFEADTPSIIKYNNELMMIYHNNRPTTRWMRTSSDGGETWSPPNRLFEHTGSNGASSLVIDSENNLHMYFGNRITGSPDIHGAWHSQWVGTQWSKPEAIVSGPQIAVGPNGEEGFDPSFLQATMSRGNLAFVIWRHDPMAGPENIWYSYQILDAIELPVTPLPSINLKTPTPSIQPSDTAIHTMITTPTSTEIDQPPPILSPNPSPRTFNPNTNILAGIIPISLLILLIVIAQRRSR